MICCVTARSFAFFLLIARRNVNGGGGCGVGGATFASSKKRKKKVHRLAMMTMARTTRSTHCLSRSFAGHRVLCHAQLSIRGADGAAGRGAAARRFFFLGRKSHAPCQRARSQWHLASTNGCMPLRTARGSEPRRVLLRLSYIAHYFSPPTNFQKSSRYAMSTYSSHSRRNEEESYSPSLFYD